MWDPNIGLGTVTHQTIGYLFPMGPYYWLMQTLGFPDWVAQRLWLGTILFAAGAGVLFLCARWAGRQANRRSRAGWSSPLRSTCSPRTSSTTPRAISVILLPWAALPWLIGMAMRAGREGGWRYPALFALVVAIVGGVNATALLFAGIGPVLWFVYAMWVSREIAVRRGTRGGRPHRCADARRLAVVDRRPLGAGQVRHPDPPLHRDLRDGGEGLERAGGAARARLLVLLRRRQARPVDRAERRLHPAPVAHRCRLPPGDRWPSRCRSSAVEAARLLRRTPRDRHDHRGRLTPVRRPDALRVDLLPIRASRPRARAAVDAARRAADRALARGAARRRDASRSPGGARPWVSWPR